MKQKLMAMAVITIFFGTNLSAQEDLTPAEQAYKDSIANLNEVNEAIAQSQEVYNQGIQKFSAKNYQGALRDFSKSVSIDPNFTAAYYNKGVCENELSKYKEAASTLSALLRKDPSYSKAYFQRGRAYQGLNDYLNSEKDYLESIKIDPENPKAHYNFGTLKFLQQDYEGALKSFSKTIEALFFEVFSN